MRNEIALDGWTLRLHRKRLGLSVKQVSLFIGVAEKHYYRMEKSHVKCPHDSTIDKLVLLFGVPRNVILGINPKEPKEVG